MRARSTGDFDALPSAPALAQRGAAAIQQLDAAIDEAEPMRLVLHRVLSAMGTPRPLGPIFDFLEKRVPGSARGESRYRWELSHRVGVRHPAYARSETEWRAWRDGEAQLLERKPFEVELRLLLPILLTGNLDVLLEASAGADSSLAGRAAALLDEAAPLVRRDFARYIAANDVWEDTFALWCLTRMPRVLDLLHSLAVALGVSYAAGRRGPVLGLRFPYYEKPLVSATAQLASGLLELGLELEVVAELIPFVLSRRRTSGGWGDDEGRDDLLTTFIAADLLARTDPTFDLAPTLQLFDRTQGPDGLWRALGPDAPWLTAEIVALACNAAQPFAKRFRWPHCGRSVMDQKTGVPFFTHFVDVANLLTRMPGLASAPIELGFIDLIGFRGFNNRFGQDAGDEVLRMFATQLRTVPLARAIRDGGDEFLVVGAPTRAPLVEDVRALMAAWLPVFHERFGADVKPVLPRIIISRASGADLRDLRQRLGREITGLKELAAIPETGVLVES